ARADFSSMTDLVPREEQVLGRLQRCQSRRGELLERAKGEGLPSNDLRTLTTAIPGPRRRELERRTHEAGERARLLAHQSLTNWVVVQRTLLHLSGMLEIIATGGRIKPTYGKEPASVTAGNFVDQAA